MPRSVDFIHSPAIRSAAARRAPTARLRHASALDRFPFLARYAPRSTRRVEQIELAPHGARSRALLEGRYFSSACTADRGGARSLHRPVASRPSRTTTRDSSSICKGTVGFFLQRAERRIARSTDRADVAAGSRAGRSCLGTPRLLRLPRSSSTCPSTRFVLDRASPTSSELSRSRSRRASGSRRDSRRRRASRPDAISARTLVSSAWDCARVAASVQAPIFEDRALGFQSGCLRLVLAMQV